MMKFLLMILATLTIMISCGQREEKEKEIVYNDPRFQASPCECKCITGNCGQCPPQCTISIVNTNNGNGSCDKKDEYNKHVCPVCPTKETPIIVVQQQQNQEQEQSTQSQNDNNNYNDADSTNTNTSTNDNSREFVFKTVINKRWYDCFRPCNNEACWGSSPQTVAPYDQVRIREGSDGQPLECFMVPGQM